ncbi:Arm DNA-binding domain-containing protein [Maribacter sp. ACAM166]|uniref:Arm DNA-binding domain-containing protein n=1 Tax=Maribacter sp. ACAM166 TaxID=2508996 RepID=UPI0010FD5E8F|nr:Arm DNA-binding domain-containing protein [Maribacter sp. ACAM166]TLP71730.1 recombinase [Maribacter sp. ACAM166]
MNQKTLSVLFYLNKSKVNSKGVCPIKCRMTFNKRRKEFSTGEFIGSLEWNAKKQKTYSNTIANQQINLQLEIISVNIKKAYLQLQMLDVAFGVEKYLLNT